MKKMIRTIVTVGIIMIFACLFDGMIGSAAAGIIIRGGRFTF